MTIPALLSGGTRFWVDTPVVHDIRETLDIKVTDTLSISVLVVDDKGPGGITQYKSIMGIIPLPSQTR